MSNIFALKLEQWDLSYQVQTFNPLTQDSEIMKE